MRSAGCENYPAIALYRLNLSIFAKQFCVVLPTNSKLIYASLQLRPIQLFSRENRADGKKTVTQKVCSGIIYNKQGQFCSSLMSKKGTLMSSKSTQITGYILVCTSCTQSYSKQKSYTKTRPRNPTLLSPPFSA